METTSTSSMIKTALSLRQHVCLIRVNINTYLCFFLLSFVDSPKSPTGITLPFSLDLSVVVTHRISSEAARMAQLHGCIDLPRVNMSTRQQCHCEENQRHNTCTTKLVGK